MIRTKTGRVMIIGTHDRDGLKRIATVEQSVSWQALVQVCEAKTKRAARLFRERQLSAMAPKMATVCS